MSNQLAVVGDVHGDVERLNAMLSKLDQMPSRKILLVGDYINRGRHSKAVIDLLLSASHRDHVTPLLGNHERSLLDFLTTGNFAHFAQCGGIPTIRSYLTNIGRNVVRQFIESFPVTHKRFIESLPLCYETDDLLVSHAGFDPAKPFDRSYEAITSGSHGDVFLAANSRPRPVVVFGHFIQRTGEPYIGDGIYCVDTGCGTVDGAPLTALLLPEFKWVFV